MKRFVILVLVLLMLLTSAFPVQASQTDENPITPRYTYLNIIETNLGINASTGKATCSASCQSISGYNVKIVCELQQYRNATWTTLQTWTKSGNANGYVSGSKTVASGYKYRAYATYYVYNSSGRQVEKVTDYNSVTY